MSAWTPSRTSSGQVLEAAEDGGEAVVGAHAGGVELLAVGLEQFGEVGLHHVAEDDGVRDLHHGGLQVRGEEDAVFLGAGNLGCQERIQGGGAHHGAVDDLAGQHGERLLQDLDRAVFTDQLDGDGAVGVNDHGLLVRAEVVSRHGGNVGLGVCGPGTHGVRVLAGVVLHGQRRAAVRVAFTQDRVYCGALDLVVAGADGRFLIGGGVVRVIRQVVALALELGDGGLQLRDRSADVRQLDDVGFRRLCQFTQFSKGVTDLLLRGEVVTEHGDDAPCERDVTGLHLHTCGRSKRLDDRQERISSQHRRFVGVGIDNLGHARASPWRSADFCGNLVYFTTPNLPEDTALSPTRDGRAAPYYCRIGHRWTAHDDGGHLSGARRRRALAPAAAGEGEASVSAFCGEYHWARAARTWDPAGAALRWR